MNRACLPAIVFAIAAGSFEVCADPAASQPAGQSAKVLVGDGFVVAVPAQWDASEIKTKTMLLHIPGDGNGVPAFDDSGSPLQVGMSVEHFIGFKFTLDQAVQTQIDTVKEARQLEQKGDPSQVKVKLADGREAVVLTFEFIKQKRRLSTQIKMIVKGDGDDHWIVSAWAVGGLESKAIQADDPLIQWLTAHVTTFSTDAAKIDNHKLPGPFQISKRD